jgi:hypothetical protein
MPLLVYEPMERVRRRAASVVDRMSWRLQGSTESYRIGHRNDFPRLLNYLGLTGEGAEIGTWVGRYANRLLSVWSGTRLHCIDPWIHFDLDAGYVDICNQSQEQMDRWYNEARQRLAKYGDRCAFHRMMSEEAVLKFADGQLDFVYIDAQHQYEAVRDDILRWAPKVKVGGYLAGHDYIDGARPQGVYGVKSAVDEWAARHEKRVVSSREPGFPSWFIRL